MGYGDGNGNGLFSKTKERTETENGLILEFWCINGIGDGIFEKWVSKYGFLTGKRRVGKIVQLSKIQPSIEIK